jgi:hypothetical protein
MCGWKRLLRRAKLFSSVEEGKVGAERTGRGGCCAVKFDHPQKT